MMSLARACALLKNFARYEDGLEMVEWGVVTALLTGVGALVFQSLGLGMVSRITQLSLYVSPP